MELRKIKFRAIEPNQDEFVYGDLLHGVKHKKGNMYILPQTDFYPSGCNDLDGWFVKPETIGQYTGLKDKNGKEIYEGDVVQDSENRNHTIVFSHGTFRSHKTNTIHSTSWEIIGNIHQNPELI